MKQILNITVFTLVIMITTRCNQNSPAPSNGGNSNGTNNTTTMTPLETSLVGNWKVKRTEYRSLQFSIGFGDTTFHYINHYNYYNSILELKSTPSLYTGYYEGLMALNDNTMPQQIAWKEGPNNSISMPGYGSFFIIKYLSNDSMVIDANDGIIPSNRYFLNKNVITPKMNQVELQLIGNPWQLISENGTPPLYPKFKIFKSNWYNNNGYYSIDSVLTSLPTIPFLVTQDPWEVLFPNRVLPILKSDGIYKIVNLTSNNLRLEVIGNPAVNSVSSQTLIYSR